ncbi:LysR family transcriptional regulator [Verminephrobacter eiseniae]|nr:LysR family transcriptional regulator [Verminephrobacter eiseniae]MCW5284548.1 LysR family transcriptional regulator [Verminephrobacter eiseniae]MCW5302254.1 LysR family transcriptional regulator [Verminephrobacter eiseniae]MCW8179882.1 LysR family transcriptional regulator [Verminephrobacter eiseniae]MCW8189931.1 LysR family transcriptional regulator [Verminephrobacter eiseniae]
MGMGLRQIDLNLLVTFQALVEERNVSRAAERLALSQSAVSHALKRLRNTFQDELLVRGPRGMEPTPRAVTLAIAVKSGLATIETAVDEKRSFDPATCHSTYYLSVTEYVRPFIMAHMCAYVREAAPHVRLVFESPDEHQVGSAVAYEGLQIRLADLPVNGPMESMRLFDDTFAVAMRREHPFAEQELTLEKYLQLAHIKVTGVGSSAIDRALTARSLVRDVVVKMPNWLEALEVVECTDLVVAMPNHWTRLGRLPRCCITRPLPLALQMPIDAAWHPRNSSDPAHVWLRETVRQAFAARHDRHTAS